MENEITVRMIRDAVRDNQPELAAEYVVLLAKDRDLWKEQALETVLFVSERKEQIDALKRVNAEQLTRIEELVDQVEDLKAVSERTAAHALVVEEERDDIQANYTRVTRAYEQRAVVLRNQGTLINRLRLERDEAQEENKKLREAVVQAPMVPSHVCSRECAHD